MNTGWYVVHTLSGHEEKVKETLEGRIVSDGMQETIFRVLVPTESVSEVRAGKKRVTERRIFPGYIMVEMALTDDNWYFIKEIPGVIGFIGSGKPMPLMDEEVNEILDQIEKKKEKVKPKVLFEKGEMIKINDGPFVNFNGVIEEIDPNRGKLKVMVSIFGRSTPVELEYWQVERT